MKEIYFAGGCFWGLQKFLSLINGVVETEAVYANGTKANPSYEEVCRGGTHFAEAVKVKYDEGVITLAELLRLFYQVIDPTAVNRQGNDVGEQYRTGIYYVDAADEAVARQSLAELATQIQKPLAIELLPLANVYAAEEYHQRYLDKNPRGYCHIGAQHFAVAAAYGRK
jgi:methionine-S-sulfoxide reductase